MPVEVRPPALNGAAPEESSHAAQASVPGRDIYEQISSLVGGIPEAIAQLDAQREQVADEFQAKLDVILDERRSALEVFESRKKELNALLRAMGHKPVESPPKTKRRKGESPYGAKMGLSDAKALLVVETILAHGDNDGFATIKIHEEAGSGWHDSSTHTFVAYLRNLELIRRKGKDPTPGTRGRWLYQIWDRQKLIAFRDHLAAQAEA